MAANNRKIAKGLHTITINEICAGAHYMDRRRRCTGDTAHYEESWPEGKSNRGLASSLCEKLRCEECESVCGFGREYLKRVTQGIMSERRIL